MLLTKYTNKKFLKKYQLNSLDNIKKNFNQLYLFRYHNLNGNEILCLKQKLKKLNFNFIIIKKKLFLPFKNKKGALLLIFSNNPKNILSYNIFLKKLHLISSKYLDSCLIFNQKYFLILKQQRFLNNILLNKFLVFLYHLSRI